MNISLNQSRLVTNRELSCIYRPEGPIVANERFKKKSIKLKPISSSYALQYLTCVTHTLLEMIPHLEMSEIGSDVIHSRHVNCGNTTVIGVSLRTRI